MRRLSTITAAWLFLLSVSGCHLIFPFELQLGQLDGQTGSPDASGAIDGRAETHLDPDWSPSDAQDTTPPVDNGSSPLDKGITPPQDKGSLPLDKGTPPVDKSIPPDQVTPPDQGTIDTGPCGCTDPQCCSVCSPLPEGTKCTHTNGYPHHCDGLGNCIECIDQGSQCGFGDPKPCCYSFTCDLWPSYPSGDTCGP